MNSEKVKGVFLNPDDIAIEGVGEQYGAMEEPAYWVPYSPDTVRLLESEGYIHDDTFTGVELRVGKGEPGYPARTLEVSVRSASWEGDVVLVSRGRGRDRQFVQIWVRPNETSASQ